MLCIPSSTALTSLNIFALIEYCKNELAAYQRGGSETDQYSVELFRRAFVARHPDAWYALEQCFHTIMIRWMRSHPQRSIALHLDSDENYVALAFSRCWQASSQRVELKRLASGLRYLRVSLNSAVLDTIRAYRRHDVISLPEAGELLERLVADQPEAFDVWNLIKHLFPHVREQHIAFLLFHCGLKPREIITFCSDEFSDVQEIYRMRRIIIERLQRNMTQLRWKLSSQC